MQMNRTSITKQRLLLLISLIVLIVVITVSSVFLYFRAQSATADGKVISSEVIKIPGQNPKINIYKIYYYSEGVRTEALLTEPIWSGQYPLIVDLHGGLTFGGDPATYNFPDEYTDGYSVEQISKGPNSAITLYPQYRGYGGSEGEPQGLVGSTLDAHNAINAVKSLLGDKVKEDSLYLIGHSFGGGVALRMASERNDIKAVAAVASYVGSDTIVRWIEDNPEDQSTSAQVFRYYIEDYRHEALVKKGTLLDAIPQIMAPVLFLQGIRDTAVMWQMVEQFVNEMEEAGKTVKLIKYPDGQHDLYYQIPDAGYQIIQWFKEYGFSNR